MIAEVQVLDRRLIFYTHPEAETETGRGGEIVTHKIIVVEPTGINKKNFKCPNRHDWIG